MKRPPVGHPKFVRPVPEIHMSHNSHTEETK